MGLNIILNTTLQTSNCIFLYSCAAWTCYLYVSMNMWSLFKKQFAGTEVSRQYEYVDFGFWPCYITPPLLHLSFFVLSLFALLSTILDQSISQTSLSSRWIFWRKSMTPLVFCNVYSTIILNQQLPSNLVHRKYFILNFLW